MMVNKLVELKRKLVSEQIRSAEMECKNKHIVLLCRKKDETVKSLQTMVNEKTEADDVMLELSKSKTKDGQMSKKLVEIYNRKLRDQKAKNKHLCVCLRKKDEELEALRKQLHEKNN